MKILYVTTVGGTMRFFENFISDLIDAGHTVDIMCNEAVSKVPDIYKNRECKIYHHSATRKPLSKGTLRTVKEIKELIAKNQYDIVHCHTPIAAACTRLACKSDRKHGLKVFYTAHGFHFYKGAPIKNWLLYYPIEKVCSYFTDVLITINKEDYDFSCHKLNAKHSEYVPGVGIEVQAIRNKEVDYVAKRREIHVPLEAFLMLSVGELNRNKNHEVVIRALAEMKNEKVHYAIAGRGGLAEYLVQLSEKLGVAKQVHVLGYRTDIAELYKVADLCCFPSIREGLGLAAIEGMAVGLPLIVSDNRGTRAYAENDINAIVCSPRDIDAWKQGIERLVHDSELRLSMGIRNRDIAEQYDVTIINIKMEEIYGLQ